LLDVDSALGYIHLADVGSVAYISDVHTAHICIEAKELNYYQQ
jgi:hypothetical protein